MRTKEYKKNIVWESAWIKAIEPVMERTTIEFKTWPLFERSGTEWDQQTKRFVQATNMDDVYRKLRSNADYELFHADSLSRLYLNLNNTLNTRSAIAQDYLERKLKQRLSAHIKRKTQEFERRQGHQIEDRWQSIWNDRTIYFLVAKVWESLHSDIEGNLIRADFTMLLQSGFLPLMMKGDYGKNCQITFF